MNLANEIRFGPDVEWLKAPEALDENDPDFWTAMLQPSEERLDQVLEAVQRYLPGVEKSGFSADCKSTAWYQTSARCTEMAPSSCFVQTLASDQSSSPTQARLRTFPYRTSRQASSI